MIVFFDILVLDDDICLSKPHRQRRLLLKDAVKTIHGRAELSEQEIIDSSRLDSLDQLEVSFAKAIAQCWEGYVLKASDEPYFPIYSAGTNATFGRWIKLKKDYIQGLGDTVDLALIGAYYDAGDAANLPSLKGLKWTHFLVGCLLNKDSVLELGETPRFRIIDAVNRHCMHIDRLKVLNQQGEFSACEPDEFNTFAVEYGRKELSKACVLFKKPFVVELMGSGFEKPPGARYYALRFPRILKIYTDRTFEDAVSFQELQILADDARSVPTEDLNDEIGQWRKRLKVGNGLKQYTIPRSRSLSSTCSSDSDTEMETDSTDSRATSQGSKGGEKPETKTPQFHHQISQQLDRSQPGGSTSGIPVVYLDDTDSSLSPGSPSHYKRISTQNSQTPHRRPLIEIEPGNRTGEKRDPYASDISQTKTKIAASNPQKDRRISVPCEQHTQPVDSSQAPDVSPLPFKLQHVLQSLLTTVPVYMSGQRAGRHTMSNLSSHSHLHEFIKTLISPDAIVSLKKSNPRAEREALSFGIFLVNPGEYSLGKEIHDTVNAIPEISYPRNPRAPNKCKIIFLNSAILEREMLPEDLRFFDRETWCGLGRQYYYACLEWDLNGSFKDLGVAATSAIANGEFNNSINYALPALSVNFDESEILALGEYILDRADDQMK